MRAWLHAISDVISTLAMAAWVGGHAALGAFAARIAFQELSRPEAARTMTRVFHEFDYVVLVCVALLAVSALIGVVVRPSSTRSQIRLGLELGLCALGTFEVFHVHAQIEAMFAAGRTLEPAFQVFHRLSERCSHAELGLFAASLALRAWPSRLR